jgi:hypothetical protein
VSESVSLSSCMVHLRNYSTELGLVMKFHTELPSEYMQHDDSLQYLKPRQTLSQCIDLFNKIEKRVQVIRGVRYAPKQCCTGPVPLLAL